jgi:hypothetical protein
MDYQSITKFISDAMGIHASAEIFVDRIRTTVTGHEAKKFAMKLEKLALKLKKIISELHIDQRALALNMAEGESIQDQICEMIKEYKGTANFS